MYKFLFSILMCCLLAYSSSGQKKLPKPEAKKWKTKLKQTSPEQFKSLYEGYNVLTTENNSLRKQLRTLESQPQPEEELEKKDEVIEKLKKQVDKAKEVINNLKTEASKKIKSSKSGTSNATGEDYTKGIVYKVQVGAFRDPKLSEFTANGNWWEEEADGLKKYTIGYFRDYFEANLFKKYIRAMGVKDAWVVAYENNARKDIKQVLASQGQKN